MEGTLFHENRLHVYPGDQLVLYTDGITEASDPAGNFYGGSRLEELLRDNRMLCSEPLANRIIGDVKTFVDGAEPFDDIALLVISLSSCRKALKDEYPAHEIRLSNRVDDLQRIVKEVDILSREWGLPGKTRMEINLILEELFTNSVFYAFDDKRHHEIVIRFTRITEGLEITYRDDGRPFNPLEERPAKTSGELDERRVGGLGIHLVRELADAIDYRREENINIVMVKKFVRENF
jgi:anti-sigma regulatory factor (Ser/Thr protein kinase)